MDTIVLSNVSIFTSCIEIAEILNNEGILVAYNTVEFLNNPFSKTVLIQVKYWHDSEQAYQIIKELRYNGETKIETKDQFYEAKCTGSEKITIDEQDERANFKCEELDEYLEQIIKEEECVWMHNYDKESREYEMNREESYLYLDLRDLIGDTCS